MTTAFLSPVLTALAGLSLMALPGVAQDLPRLSNGVTRVDAAGLIVATCRTGEGCHCYQSNHSLATLETQTDIAPPEGLVNPILVRTGDGVFWTGESGHAIDLLYGGDGLCDPQVFPAEETGLPRNGPWTMTITGNSLSGCPAQVASAIAGAIDLGGSERRSIVWPRPFSMAPLTADNPAAGPWIDQGGGVWHNEVFSVNGALGRNAQVSMTARIVSPVEIALTQVFSMDVLAILTGEACRSTTQARLRFAG
ncbi:hypothetical protein [Pararhodobacter zhoushanensis]|uniref:Uncharacterized protein n=1 Tax=Pararhodobacter zhoushanensis TaxID=2479545 RepID=A0ABT3GW61_9RHOB|nr:hypothetical protein [Pararhodobacter zhoushanensis]MCW1931776.1 hypothetical protein [Pararhodobacter zhoushanensis]